MRIVIDLQACQSANLAEPAGRYALALLPHLLAELGALHEVHVLANAELAGSLPALREVAERAAAGRLAWHTPRLPAPRAATPQDAWRGTAGGLMRDSLIDALEPQVELVLDAAAGWHDEIAVSPEAAAPRHARVLLLARGLPQVQGGGAFHAASALWERGVVRRLCSAERVLALSGPAANSARAAGVDAARLAELPAAPAQAAICVAQAVSAAADVRMVPASLTVPRRPRLAYVSPLPPAASGIADYSAELLPALAEYYDIELIVEQREPLPAVLAEAFPVRSAAWLQAHAESYDRVLYHFGNSPFHAHMVGLLRRHPGTVVLHDFFLGHLFGYLQHSGLQPEALRQALYRSHGYRALALRRTGGEAAAIAAYPCNLEILASARSVIVHSDHARELIRDWYGTALDVPVRQTGLAHASPDPAARGAARAAARRELGLAASDLLVCSFGYVGAGKLSRELVQAWLDTPLAADPAYRLVLVGGHQMQDGYADELRAQVGGACGAGVEITGYVPPDIYRQYLAAADVAVQLRANSRGETSRAVLDAMAHGLALIANAHGSSAELPDEVAIKLPDACTVDEIAAALMACAREPGRRDAVAASADRHVRVEHDPARVAARYRDAIEAGAANAHATYWGRAQTVVAGLARAQTALGWRPRRREAFQVARMLADEQAPPALRRLLPDIGLLQPRADAAADGEALRGLMLMPDAEHAPVNGSTVRAAQMQRVYAEAGMVLEPAHYDLFERPDALRADWHTWSARQAAGLADRLRRGRYDFIQIERGLLWPLYRAAAELLRGEMALPCLVYSSHRDEAARVPAPQAGAVSACERELAGVADVLLAPHIHEAERLAAWRGDFHRVHIFGNGGQVPEADWRDSEQVYRDYLPQLPYALIVSDGDAGAVEGFFHLLGTTLAYLPPDAVLVVAGGLCERLQADLRFQRWSGINGSRCVLIGRPDALGLAALRRHAHMLVLPRIAYPGDRGPDIKTAEALQDGHCVLATSAAIQGYERASNQTWVHIEDEPSRFRQALAAGLRRAWRPATAEPEGLAWHYALAGLPAVVREAVATVRESA